MAAAFVELDVRPILRAGGEPFQKIMQTLNMLLPGQGLRLLATFKPVPLFTVMGQKGFSHEEREIGGGDWEVLFRPPMQSASTHDLDASLSSAPDASRWPEPVQHLDNRTLDPPEPMVRILATTESMGEGEVLSALLCREPVFLLPELAKRGHAWKGGFESDGTTYKILVRIGAKQERLAASVPAAATSA